MLAVMCLSTATKAAYVGCIQMERALCEQCFTRRSIRAARSGSQGLAIGRASNLYELPDTGVSLRCMGPGAAGLKDNGAEVQVQEVRHEILQRVDVARQAQHDQVTNCRHGKILDFHLLCCDGMIMCMLHKRIVYSLLCICCNNQLKQCTQKVDTAKKCIVVRKSASCVSCHFCYLKILQHNTCLSTTNLTVLTLHLWSTCSHTSKPEMGFFGKLFAKIAYSYSDQLHLYSTLHIFEQTNH